MLGEFLGIDEAGRELTRAGLKASGESYPTTTLKTVRNGIAFQIIMNRFSAGVRRMSFQVDNIIEHSKGFASLGLNVGVQK